VSNDKVKATFHNPTPAQHTILYRSESGQEIRVTVPWGHHSGRIPPPQIEFSVAGSYEWFVYAGSEDA
jgi:hypothetical protein